MQRQELLRLAERVLRLPTAPYHEHAVREFVIQYCRELGLRPEVDRAGNVVVKYPRPQARSSRHQSGSNPLLVFVAHMDHPGFEILGGNRAEFLGGVPKEMFARGVGVRFYHGLSRGDSSPQSLRGKSHGTDKSAHSGIAAGIKSLDLRQWPKRKVVALQFKQGTVSPKPGTLGMWDLPAFRVRGDRLHAAAIDDVLGTAVMLATLSELVRRGVRVRVWCAFTRAEEVGFQGVLALLRENKIPKNAVVISVEMSSERPWARVGDGPVVRVGDRATIFDPNVARFLMQVVAQCRKLDSRFRAQRALMDGGTCEATAFAGFSYRTGGLCLPLGNYHNIGKNLRPRAEFVSLDDLERLLQLAVTTCLEWRDFDASATKLTARLLSMTRHAPRSLS